MKVKSHDFLILSVASVIALAIWVGFSLFTTLNSTSVEVGQIQFKSLEKSLDFSITDQLTYRGQRPTF